MERYRRNSLHGCLAHLDRNRICGETQTLEITRQLKQLYEDRMKLIEEEDGGDSFQAKIKLQRDWINDLTEQTNMLVEVVEQLEQDATERIALYNAQLQTQIQSEREEQKLVETDVEDLRKIIAALQRENDMLRKAITQARDDLQQLESSTDRYLQERDEYKQKHRESIDLMQEMATNFNKDREGYDKRHRDSLAVIEELNTKKNTEIQAYAKQHRDSLATLEELKLEHDAYKQKYQESLIIIDELKNESEQELEKARRESAEDMDRFSSLMDELAGFKDRERENSETIENLRLNIEHMQTIPEEPPEYDEENEESVTPDTGAVVPFRGRNVTAQTSVTSSKSANVGPTGSVHSKKSTSDEDGPQEVEELEEVIHQLADSVSKMMEKTKAKAKEQPASEELVVALKNKEQETERFSKNQEISNLKQTIDELHKALQNSHKREECICGLKEELKKLRAENAQKANIIRFLKTESGRLGDQLHNLQQLLKITNVAPQQEEHNRQVAHNFAVLQQEYDQLQNRFSVVDQQLKRERKINKVHAARIEELHQTIGQKTLDLNKWEAALYDTRKKFEHSVCRCKELETRLMQMHCKNKQYESARIKSEERTDICRNEIGCCKRNLGELREKLQGMRGLLNFRNEQFIKMQTELQMQVNLLASLKRECDNNKKHNEECVCDYKHTIKVLSSKLAMCEKNYHALNEEFKKNQVKLIKAVQHEATLQEDFSVKERDLNESIHKSEHEQVHLKEIATNLQFELNNLKEDLLSKDRTIHLLSANINKMKNGNCEQLTMALKERTMFKDQMNAAIQAKTKLQFENEKLRIEVARLMATTSEFEEKSHLVSQQLDQCLIELQAIQMDKVQLDTKNKQLTQELFMLQKAFSNLNRDYRYKSESIINLEMELIEAKTSQDSLQEQQHINDRLNAKVHDRNTAIEKLKKEKQLLQTKLRTSEAPYKRSRVLNVRGRPVPPRQLTWNLSTQESREMEGNSPSSSEWRTFADSDENAEYAEEYPLVLVRRVESLSKELQMGKRYWKSQMTANDYKVTRDE